MSSKSRKGFHFVRVLIYFSFGRMFASPWLVPPSFDTSGVNSHSALSTHDSIARSLFRADLAKHFSFIGRKRGADRHIDLAKKDDSFTNAVACRRCKRNASRSSPRLRSAAR